MKSRARFLASLALVLLSLSPALNGCATLQRWADLQRALLLNDEGIKLREQGRYQEAIARAEEALAIWEGTLGPEHRYVATGLDNLAQTHLALGEATASESLLVRALAIRERHLQGHPVEYGKTLNNLAELYRYRGEYAKTEKLLVQALETLEGPLGTSHPLVATCLNNLAHARFQLGKHANAESLYRKALAIEERQLGSWDPGLSTTLGNLAMVLMERGEYAEAETRLRRALAIREQAQGPHHPDVALALNNLAALHLAMADYARAEPLHRRSLSIRERALGPDHPDVSRSLANLAVLLDLMGDYVGARTLYERAVAIRERALGPNHPELATPLSNLASHYDDLGDHDRAEALLGRALAIREKALGPDHPDMASILNRLGTVRRTRGDSAGAEALYGRSLAIRERALGPDHPDVALSLNNLAGFYKSRGDSARAEALYLRALALVERYHGTSHPMTATTLMNLASLRFAVGDLAEAERLFRRALAIQEQVLGPGHPEVSWSLDYLGRVIAAMGRFGEALELMKRAQEIHAKLIDQVMGFTAEEQKGKFLATLQAGLEGLLSLVRGHLNHDPQARRDALDIWLRRKGMVLDAQRRFQEALLYTGDAEAIGTFQNLAAVRARLSKLLLRGPTQEAPEVYRQKLARLDEEKDRLEARLSQLSQTFALKRKMGRADAEKVAAALPQGTALLEFARPDTYDFQTEAKGSRWRPAHYLAFVLHKGQGDRVAMVDLGEAEPIDRAVGRLRESMAKGGQMADLRHAPAARELHEVVFSPLREALGSVREIFVSPDGALSLVPFEVLQGADGRFLIETYTFNYLATGRDILGFGAAARGGGRALLMGDPDYDLEGGRDEETPGTGEVTRGKVEPLYRRATALRGVRFPLLPGTREEVRRIHTLLGEDAATVCTGRDANEEILRRTEGPQTLHLATHGFFLGDPTGNVSAPARVIQQERLPWEMEVKRIYAENPLVRSGIALAGANRALKTDTPESGEGIVTAEKILGLRLHGTELVVLSACDTGLGEVRAGEGVFGLRRAFAQAGARSLVMSLWSVPDRETRELMSEFYANVTQRGMDRCRALREAALREMRVVKERYGHPHPFFWGAFVFLGEP